MKNLIHAAMLIVAGALLLVALYLARGSVEMFPSDEQQGEVRLAMSVVATNLLAVEGLLWGVLIAVRRKEEASSR